MSNLQQAPGVRVVTVALVRNHKEALQIKAKLKLAGIECDLIPERSFTAGKAAGKAFGAFKIQVARADVPRSLSILASKKSAAAGDSRSKVLKRTPRKIAFDELAFGIPAVSLVAVGFILLVGLVLFLY